MKNKSQIFILFLMLLVIPTGTVLAFGNPAKKENTEKKSCSKEDGDFQKKSCCNNDEKDDDGCGGVCDNTFCHCPNSVNIPVFFKEFELTTPNNFTILVNDWAYIQHIPKGIYHSIWQPPKIS